MKRKISKFSNDRRGTAEIVGSVMFLVILLFAFTNIYLWHDSASREMNGVIAEKLNTPVSISNVTNGLVVTNNGGFEVSLSRLWLITDSGHYYANLEPYSILVAAGETVNVRFGNGVVHDDGSVSASFVEGADVLIDYSIHNGDVCKVLTTLGNMAACVYTS